MTLYRSMSRSSVQTRQQYWQPSGINLSERIHFEKPPFVEKTDGDNTDVGVQLFRSFNQER